MHARDAHQYRYTDACTHVSVHARIILYCLVGARGGCLALHTHGGPQKSIFWIFDCGRCRLLVCGARCELLSDTLDCDTAYRNIVWQLIIGDEHNKTDDTYTNSVLVTLSDHVCQH
jgi:hypothetical protein